MRAVINSLIITVGLSPFVVLIYLQAENNKKLINELNVSQAVMTIQKDSIKRLNEENYDLRNANECLIKYSYRDRCITAIKHTPLPKIKNSTEMNYEEH